MLPAGPDTCLLACRPAAAAPTDASPRPSSESVSDDEVRHDPLLVTPPASACITALHCEMQQQDPSFWLRCSRLTHGLTLGLHVVCMVAVVWLKLSALRKHPEALCAHRAVRLMSTHQLSVLCCTEL